MQMGTSLQKKTESSSPSKIVVAWKLLPGCFQIAANLPVLSCCHPNAHCSVPKFNKRLEDVHEEIVLPSIISLIQSWVSFNYYRSPSLRFFSSEHVGLLTECCF
ncbi:hypothetical protein CsatB_023289 [Cannabis sativa]|uniref:uncharacterized protein LOC133037266 n=1 Tax=Cannabis sativa TaxID=3483 RepID=UPI0029CA3AE2|nr:uncharacterized protein LOC133037266 [Cannabis sativa]XP_060971648.1 uncharacterized protein LOC133037904 [Cannabis sativa]